MMTSNTLEKSQSIKDLGDSLLINLKWYGIQSSRADIDAISEKLLQVPVANGNLWGLANLLDGELDKIGCFIQLEKVQSIIEALVETPALNKHASIDYDEQKRQTRARRP